MTTQQLMEIYKHETGVTQIEMFDFDYWLIEKQMNESWEQEFRQHYNL